MIGGNVELTLYNKLSYDKNEIGEVEPSNSEGEKIMGFLDYISGSADLSKFHAKVEESTHVFICDYADNVWMFNSAVTKCGVTGYGEFQILLVDDPMGLHQHIEVYLKYIGDLHSVM